VLSVSAKIAVYQTAAASTVGVTYYIAVLCADVLLEAFGQEFII